MATTITEKSSTGLEANLAGALAYALGFVSGLVLLLIEKDSRFVRFHAVQSLVVFLGLFVFWQVVFWLPGLGWIFLLLSPLIGLASLVLWIFLMIKAYQGERFKLPIVGDIAEQQANK